MLRIAFSCENDQGLEARVHAHFGHSPFFTFVDMDDCEVKKVEVIANPYAEQHQPGEIPGFIRSHNAEVMVTGGMGGRAVGFFTEAGVEPVTGAQGTVQQALDQYLSGSLKGAAGCDQSHEHGHAGHDHH